MDFSVKVQNGMWKMKKWKIKLLVKCFRPCPQYTSNPVKILHQILEITGKFSN